MLKESTSFIYSEFKPIVTSIKQGSGEYTQIGEGAESEVWKAELSTGEFAIKIAKANVLNVRGKVKDRGLMTKGRINSGVKALGIRGLEQFVAGSTEDYAAIFQFVSGVRLTNFTVADIDQVTDDQREGLLEMIARTTEAGLVFDGANPSGANAFYDSSSGFTLIDYQEAWRPVSYSENWSYAMRSLGPVALRAFARKAS